MWEDLALAKYIAPAIMAINAMIKEQGGTKHMIKLSLTQFIAMHPYKLRTIPSPENTHII